MRSNLQALLKGAFTIFCCVISTVSFAQDGPYIFYKSKDLLLKRIVVKKDQTAVAKEEILTKKRAKRVKVEVPGNPSWNFEVALHDAPQNEVPVSAGADKMLVLSDIEGEFTAARKLFIGTGVMDEKYNWTFGTNKVVICGDLFDRGKEVPAYLWLLYKLEADAARQGGKLHVVLGNHDIMNMNGDFRYVDSSYFVYAALMQQQYHDLYTAQTVMGQWLRSKNIMEKVGDGVFMHGGVSPEVNAMQLSLAALNDTCRPYYDKKKADIPAPLRLFFDGKTSPFWYRGYHNDPKADMKDIDNTLQLFQAKYIVCGHTIVKEVARLYDGKVYAVDVNHHKGHHQALLIEQDKFYRVDDKGNKTLLSE
ncbi:calcineurin-like phosphoesterase family protein [Chitinophaga skermanii]|uniref:Calcineurin-like phosphoesterase family protein n=1 Tax=Chitinophaga skermanii TaxID=331697 RepID=A0A327QVT9_9BACT|nr:metallophosphoesterase [Chitinophaga skermanii]RAJ08510.1 calcineurin-like phosphoesterase family protein [Chitinophaga skermanii]